MFALSFQRPSLSPYTDSVKPLCWLQSLIPSIPHRQVVCFIEIKLIIFHACTHAATVSYTFTRYYVSKVSWLRNTLSKLKVGNVPKPDIISQGAFFGSKKLPSLSSLSVCPSLTSDANWELSLRFSLQISLLLLSAQRAGELRWAPPDDLSFLLCDEMQQ